MFCSGCTRRGHLVHTCRLTLPFSGLPINSPYVSVYRPIYSPSHLDNSDNWPNKQNIRNQPDSTISTAANANNRNKRPSKSPSGFENQRELKKKKVNSFSEETDVNQNTKNTTNERPRKMSSSKEQADESSKNVSEFNSGPLPDFIPLSSSNRDKKGHMIQDNEVSDTSDVVTVARIYITNDIIEKLKTSEGQEWLEKTKKTHNVELSNSDITSFLSISGKVADQEAFQTELRNWITKNQGCNRQSSDENLDNSSERVDNNYLLQDIPKNRCNLLRKIAKALDSLKDDLGDPRTLYKELTYLQSQHQQLLRQRVISPQRLSNNTTNIKGMLKKLNMVLLGQARLADGQRHLSELYSLQEKLTKLRQKNIAPELRKEIGQHYNSIFTAIERNDYAELLQKYHLNRTSKSVEKRKKKKFKLKQKMINNVTKNNTIPPLQQNTNIQKPVNDNLQVAEKGADKKKPVSNVAQRLKQLMHVHKLLVKTQPEGSNQKKLRIMLVRKLHSHISSLSQKDQMNSKALKKIKTIQSQAYAFLQSVNRLDSLIAAEL